MWQIGGLCAEKGTKLQAVMEPGIAGYEMPVTLINGRNSGKTVVILAGIHSCEFVGTSASSRAAAEIDPEKVNGRVILFHCVNINGFWIRRIRFVPEDGGNLNSVFPGDPNGTFSEKIADWFVKEIFPQADFVLDLHSGAPGQPLTPLLFFPIAKKVREESFAAAKVFNVPYLIESRAKTGPYSYAAHYMDIPGVLLERGTGGYCYEEWIQEDVKDIRRLLNHLEVCAYENEEELCAQKLISPMQDLLSDEEGVWHADITVNQEVKKGQLLGHLDDFWGKRIKEFYAEGDGVILYYTSALPIKKGHMLVSYGTYDCMKDVEKDL